MCKSTFLLLEQLATLCHSDNIVFPYLRNLQLLYNFVYFTLPQYLTLYRSPGP